MIDTSSLIAWYAGQAAQKNPMLPRRGHLKVIDRLRKLGVQFAEASHPDYPSLCSVTLPLPLTIVPHGQSAAVRDIKANTTIVRVACDVAANGAIWYYKS